MGETDDDGKILSFAHEVRRRDPDGCGHRQRFVIDERHGTVYCRECNEPVSAFHALKMIARDDSLFRRQTKTGQALLEEMKAYKPWLRAVKALEKIWRGKDMLPQCPHCHRGIEAEALASTGIVSREYEARWAGLARNAQIVSMPDKVDAP